MQTVALPIACIGNSGPLIPEVSQAINSHDLAVVSVLSGNRNFEGRIHAEVKMNYLMSPPLVVASALARPMDIDLFIDPHGPGKALGRASCGETGCVGVCIWGVAGACK